jgi:hypothetical protein
MRDHARERAATRVLIVTFIVGALIAGGFLSLIALGTRMAAEQQGLPASVVRIAA